MYSFLKGETALCSQAKASMCTGNVENFPETMHCIQMSISVVKKLKRKKEGKTDWCEKEKKREKDRKKA